MRLDSIPLAIADIVEMGRDGGRWIRVILADCSPLAVVLSFNSSECVSYACSHCLKEIERLLSEDSLTEVSVPELLGPMYIRLEQRQ